MSKEQTRLSGISPVSSSTWMTGCDLDFMVEQDLWTAIYRLIWVSRSMVGILKVYTNFADMRLSPMVSVWNMAFALYPLTLMQASRALFSFPDGPT